MVGVAGQRWRIEECFQFAFIPTWLRGLRSSLMDRLASPRHFGLGGRRQSLSVLRYQAEPLGELSTPPFFSPLVGAGGLAAFKAARGLLSG